MTPSNPLVSHGMLHTNNAVCQPVRCTGRGWCSWWWWLCCRL